MSNKRKKKWSAYFGPSNIAAKIVCFTHSKFDRLIEFKFSILNSSSSYFFTIAQNFLSTLSVVKWKKVLILNWQSYFKMFFNIYKRTM